LTIFSSTKPDQNINLSIVWFQTR